MVCHSCGIPCARMSECTPLSLPCSRATYVRACRVVSAHVCKLNHLQSRSSHQYAPAAHCGGTRTSLLTVADVFDALAAHMRQSLRLVHGTAWLLQWVPTSGAILRNVSSSSFVHRYSAGGLYDSACPGIFICTVTTIPMPMYSKILIIAPRQCSGPTVLYDSPPYSRVLYCYSRYSRVPLAAGCAPGPSSGRPHRPTGRS